MKKIISLFVVLMLASAAIFAEDILKGIRHFDKYGNLIDNKIENVNGATHSAQEYFRAKGNKWFTAIIEYDTESFYCVTDGEEAFMIPNHKFSQVYWRYPISMEEVSYVMDENIPYLLSIVNYLSNNKPSKYSVILR